MYFTHLLLLCLATTYALSSKTKCPQKCSCYLDNKGRNTVECKEGGVVGPLTLENVDFAVEVLKITAPEDNMNMITMSPALTDFRKLEEIHITRSNIPNLGMHFFFSLTKLDILNLSQNNITQPLDHNFRGLSNLKELYLDDNRIYSLPSGTFRYLTHLRILSIQRNRIKELMPRMFQQIGMLKVLKLSGNILGEMKPEVFADVPNLRVLECRGCALETINTKIYDALPYLTQLDIGDNYIKHISPNDFRILTNLRTLKLDGNKLTIIYDESFTHQSELNSLNLARNKISQIYPAAFLNLNNLTELDLSKNVMTNLNPIVFNPIENTLQKLSLSGNYLENSELIEILKKVNNLKELSIADMNLAAITTSMIPEGVNVLHLSGNYLSYMPYKALPPNLIELDISKNKFKGLDEDTMRTLSSVPNIRLDHNPWSCDLCNIIPLLNRVNRSSTFYNLKCHSPYSMEGQTLGYIKREELSWCTTPSYTTGDANLFGRTEEAKVGVFIAGASIILLLVALLLVGAGICYSRRHAAKYYTHEEKRVPEAELIFETQSPLFSDERELSFKFPLDPPEKKISIATIDEIKKDHSLVNGT